MRANPNPPKAALAPRAATKKEKELHAASVVRPVRFPRGCERTDDRRRFVTRSALMIVGDPCRRKWGRCEQDY